MSLFGGHLHNQNGNVTIVNALMLPALVGLSGLAVETGYWYYLQNEAQAAADVSAYAGAIGLRDNAENQLAIASAQVEARELGYASSDVQVNAPPKSGTFQDGRSVEVEISYDVERYVSAIFSSEPIRRSVRAVATFDEQRPACVLALDTEASGALTFSGSAGASLFNCDVMSNSIARDSVLFKGSVELELDCVNTVGATETMGAGLKLTLNECPAPREDLSRALDPYRDVTPPTTATVPCAPSFGPAYSAGPAGTTRFCGGLTLTGSATFAPGTYVIDGGTFRINSGAVVSGTGVTFFLTGGAEARFNGSAEINLSAPTSGDYAGLTFFGDRADVNADHILAGNTRSSITGAIYTPASHVDFSGNFSGAGGCLQIVSRTVTLSGAANFSSDCTSAGLQPALVPSKVSLVE